MTGRPVPGSAGAARVAAALNGPPKSPATLVLRPKVPPLQSRAAVTSKPRSPALRNAERVTPLAMSLPVASGAPRVPVSRKSPSNRPDRSRSGAARRASSSGKPEMARVRSDSSP